ncbi:MAG TPA: hypothetical protein VN668_07945 [Stellaceae bacterium]|nr:hypothetical protein [Stellaceae bacterium]
MPTSNLSRLARLWRKLHGMEAVPLARAMISELEKSDNADGAEMWRRVIIEIEKLGEVGRK